jgi:hypothetical protein
VKAIRRNEQVTGRFYVDGMSMKCLNFQKELFGRSDREEQAGELFNGEERFILPIDQQQEQLNEESAYCELVKR